MHFVIVGNGVCAMEAALALRAREAKARVTLVSDEHDHFFSPPSCTSSPARPPFATPSPTTGTFTSGWASSG